MHSPMNASPMNDPMIGSKSAKRTLNTHRTSTLTFSDDLSPVDSAEPEIDPFAGCSSDAHAPKPSNRRRSSIGASRRRSSIGGVSEVEQARITEMYRTVIQMSSENKINEKNSWSFDLIDHMGKLIRDETKTVNFQKASCTLDASVKIYSHRVDDTYASSHRILESLSRGNQGNDENAESTDKATKAKVGSKASSARLHLTDTIERNVSHLNLVTLEHDYAFDPMFHKLSKAFDEEPLMRAAEIDYHQGHKEQNVLDMADLVQRSALTAERLNSLCISSKLSEFNSILGRTGASLGIKGEKGDINQHIYRAVHMQPAIPYAATAEQISNLAHSTNAVVDGSVSPGLTTTENSMERSPAVTGGTAIDAGDAVAGALEEEGYGGVEDIAFPDLYDDNYDNGDAVFDTAEEANSSQISSIAGRRSSGIRLQWSQDPAALAQGVQGILDLEIDPSNEYAYIDIQKQLQQQQLQQQQALAMNSSILDSNNAWAGARHWKYATRSLAPKAAVNSSDPTNEDGETGADGEATGKKKKPKSKATDALASSKLDLSFQLVDESLFGISNKKDSSLCTAAAWKKQEAERDLLLLPSVDEKLQLKDLCRLYALPQVIVPPRYVNLQSLVQIYANSSNKDGRKAQDKTGRIQGLLDNVLQARHQDDVMFSQHSITGQIGARDSRLSIAASIGMQGEMMEDGDDYDQDVGYGGDDGYEPSSAVEEVEEVAEAVQAMKLEGLQVDTAKLVQADRVVGKIQIEYAKVSKRVNVAKLKSDLWSQIDDHLSSSTNVEEEEVESTLSFQQLLQEAHSEERMHSVQKDASLAYYFICLLHLANEKNLTITDQEDMADLTISMEH